MDEECSKTPYNSIYKALNGQHEILNKCCTHSGQCQYGRGKPKETAKSEQYVNLSSPAEEQAEQLTAQLKKLQAEQDAEEPKKRSERKKNKKKSVEESQAYEILGPTTEESSASSVAAPFLNSTCSSATSNGDANSSYVGVCSAAQAETMVSRRGDFSLYHLYEPRGCLDNLSAGLPLMLVYFTTTKKHRHYPIRSSGTGAQMHYSVDCGYPIVRKHISLDQLVMYYKKSCAGNPENTFADSFHWWLE